VKDLVAVAQEAAEARHLKPVGDPIYAGVRELRAGSIVVLNRRDRLVEADVKVIVEIASMRRVEREGPSAERLVRLDLGKRRACDGRERRAAGAQMRAQAG
jgi:ribosomal silencing factor RsfS